MKHTPLTTLCAMALLLFHSILLADDAAAAKAKFASPVVTTKTPGHAVDIDVDLAGAKELYLVVTDAGDTFSCDWSDWAEPRLVTAEGEKKLTELKWKSAQAGFGSVQIDKNCGGQPLVIDGKPVSYGIGTHANSVIAFDLPAGAMRFLARGGIDRGGASQAGGAASSVRFMVFTEKPPATLFAQQEAAGGGGDHEPAAAVASLDVATGVEATLFASEPMMLSPADFDIDARGRVWVCEVTNYRGRKDTRPEGDRILILEDTDGDGRADKSTVFYQGRDIDSALGICVLGNKVIVSCAPNVFVFTDENGDDKPDKKELLFTRTGQPQHDHSAHAFIFGPDGKLYWNFGNTGQRVCDRDGKPVVDMAGNVVADEGKPYRGGMAFRCNLDGSQFEVLAHNFRNNYEVTVDSFGTLWQSDNDDDGNRGVRINYVMECGNYGYVDEITGASWSTPYLGMSDEIPLRHWHLTDPGVVPNLLQTGGGSPAGICLYEGDLLPKIFRNQVIHCDPGPNVVRAYPATVDGAGYKAEMVNILYGARDDWFRPSDVCVAPVGSLFVADWYDPGVGGHAMGDVDKGRVFRVAPPGSRYVNPKFDLSTAEGAIEALKNPNLSARYLAWTKLHEMEAAAEPALLKLFTADNPRYRARALWLLAKIEGRGRGHIERAMKDADADIRVTAIRAARQIGGDIIPVVSQLGHDSSPRVRRELAIALRHITSPHAAELWAEMALQHDGKDRWYLEALGIGADGQWDSFFAAWLKKVGENWNKPAGRDIVWRSRSKQALPLLGKLIADTATTSADRVRYFRAFDFHTDPSKQQILTGLLAGNAPQQEQIDLLALKQLHGADPSKLPDLQAALTKALDASRGTDAFLDLVQTFGQSERYPEVLAMALENPSSNTGVAAARLLLRAGQQAQFGRPLGADDPIVEKALTALGLTQEKAAVELVTPVADDAKRSAAVRNAAVTALGGSRIGQQSLVALASQGKLAADVHFTAAKVLQAADDAVIRDEAAKYLALPTPADNNPLPPLAELVSRRGDAERGKTVFTSVGNCAKCHVVVGAGTEVGPNLSEIGSKLSRDAMFESILLPSAGIAQQYESFTIELDNGNVVTGLVTSETAESITVKSSDAIVRTFKKSEVVEKKKQTISLMPSDLQKTMNVDQLVDVVEYLTTLKKVQ